MIKKKEKKHNTIINPLQKLSLNLFFHAFFRYILSHNYKLKLL
jgi:hypothetical protein